ncbi:hypothetical protein MBLNU457_5738t1 [Dothideomycetes sp. NU457]
MRPDVKALAVAISTLVEMVMGIYLAFRHFRNCPMTDIEAQTSLESALLWAMPFVRFFDSIKKLHQRLWTQPLLIDTRVDTRCSRRRGYSPQMSNTPNISTTEQGLLKTLIPGAGLLKHPNGQASTLRHEGNRPLYCLRINNR